LLHKPHLYHSFLDELNVDRPRRTWVLFPFLHYDSLIDVAPVRQLAETIDHLADLLAIKLFANIRNLVNN
jgi:hypothetical protein